MAVMVKFVKRLSENWAESDEGASHEFLTVVNGLSLLWNLHVQKTGQLIPQGLYFNGVHNVYGPMTSISWKLQLDSPKTDIKGNVDVATTMKVNGSWPGNTGIESIDCLADALAMAATIHVPDVPGTYFILNIEEKDVDPIVWLTPTVKKNISPGGVLSEVLYARTQRKDSTDSTCDVELRCADGSLRAHSTVLVAQSEYFDGLFHFNEVMKKSEDDDDGKSGPVAAKVVKLKTTPVAAAAVVLRFLYCGDEPTGLGELDITDVDELLCLAAQVKPPQLDGLWAAFEIELLQRTIPDSDVCAALKMADRHELVFLRNRLVTQLGGRPSDFARACDEELSPELKAEVLANAQARMDVLQNVPF